MYLTQLYNPISYTISSIEEKKINLTSYSDFILKIENNRSLLYPDIKSLLNTIIIQENNQLNYSQIIDEAFKNYDNIIHKRGDLFGDLSNLCVCSLCLMIAAKLTFSLRDYHDDWKTDLYTFFWVNFIFLFCFIKLKERIFRKHCKSCFLRLLVFYFD